jgi:hypothetical protein
MRWAKAKALARAGRVREAGEVSKEAWRLWGAGVDGGGLLTGMDVEWTPL